MTTKKEKAISLVQYDEANLYRRLATDGNVSGLLSHFGWPDGECQTYVLLLTTKGGEDGMADRIRIFFMARLSKYALCTIHGMGKQRFLMLVQPRAQFPAQQWRTAVVALCNMLLKQFDHVSRIDASGECRLPGALNAAYRRLVASCGACPNDAFHMEEDAASILSAEERERLVACVRQLLSEGEADGAVTILRSAWKRSRRTSGPALWELIAVSIIAASPLSPWEMDNMLWENLLFTGCEPGNELAKQWLAHARAFYGELTACGGPSIYRVMKILRAEFPDKLMLSDLARRVGMNPTYVSSQFCQVTGRRFADVITEIRIEHALRLLTEDPRLKNGQLAEVSGFFSTTYFCEAFKKCVGKTVRQYVKEVCMR